MNVKSLYSEPLERSALAKIFQNPDRFVPKARKAGLEATHFFVPAYQDIFTWLMNRHENGESFERRILIADFVRSPLNDSIGDSSETLSDFFSYRMDKYESYESIIEAIKADAALRIASQSISDLSENMESQTPQSVVRSLSDAIEGISNISKAKASGVEAERLMAEFSREMNLRMDGLSSRAVPSGIPEIDEITNGGFRNKELVIISAPTSGGKSVLSLQSCIPLIREEKKVAVFSMEMGTEEVAGRLVSSIGGVHMGDIIRPVGVSKGEFDKMKTAIRIIRESGLTVWDEPKMTIDFIDEQLEETGGADLIVVDYVQLIEGTRGRNESREQEVARISKGLKGLAKKYDCPIISPSQLNDDGRVRESRAIAHDCDILLQITEEGVFVSKNRNGKRGVNLPIAMNGAYQRFEFDQALVSQKK